MQRPLLRYASACLAALSLYAHPSLSRPIVDALLDELDGDDYSDYIATLQGFGTRYYNRAGNTNARSYIQCLTENSIFPGAPIPGSRRIRCDLTVWRPNCIR